MVYGIYYYILIIYLILNIISCIKIVYVTKLLFLIFLNCYDIIYNLFFPIYILNINDIYH